MRGAAQAVAKLRCPIGGCRCAVARVIRSAAGLKTGQSAPQEQPAGGGIDRYDIGWGGRVAPSPGEHRIARLVDCRRNRSGPVVGILRLAPADSRWPETPPR